MKQPLYKAIANKFQAMQSCSETWKSRHEDTIILLVNRYMPHGSGIDTGTRFSFEDSKPDKLVFYFSYHHMNEDGYYDGWTEHKLIVTPNLWSDFDMRITGSNRNDCKEYFYQTFNEDLRMEVDA